MTSHLVVAICRVVGLLLLGVQLCGSAERATEFIERGFVRSEKRVWRLNSLNTDLLPDREWATRDIYIAGRSDAVLFSDNNRLIEFEPAVVSAFRSWLSHGRQIVVRQYGTKSRAAIQLLDSRYFAQGFAYLDEGCLQRISVILGSDSVSIGTVPVVPTTNMVGNWISLTPSDKTVVYYIQRTDELIDSIVEVPADRSFYHVFSLSDYMAIGSLRYPFNIVKERRVKIKNTVYRRTLYDIKKLVVGKDFETMVIPQISIARGTAIFDATTLGEQFENGNISAPGFIWDPISSSGGDILTLGFPVPHRGPPSAE